MEYLKKYKKTLIIIGVVAAAFVLYSVFLQPGDTQEGVVSNVPDQQPQAGREILSLLVDLKEIQLDEELLQSQVFRSFEDFSIPIAPEPSGRPNPFAPIGEDIQVTSQEDEGTGAAEGESGTGVPPQNEPAGF